MKVFVEYTESAWSYTIIPVEIDCDDVDSSQESSLVSWGREVISKVLGSPSLKDRWVVGIRVGSNRLRYETNHVNVWGIEGWSVFVPGRHVFISSESLGVLV